MPALLATQASPKRCVPDRSPRLLPTDSPAASSVHRGHGAGVHGSRCAPDAPASPRLPADTSRAPGGGLRSRRCATNASQSKVARSLQCRSSSTNTRGRSSSQRFHGLGEFPQHALARGTPTAALLQCLIRPRLAGAPASVTTSSAPAGATARPDERHLAPRPNCPKASSSGRYASPAPYCSIHCPRPIPYRLRSDDLRHKGVDEAGLADPGFPGNKYDLACALECLRPALMELRHFSLPRHQQCRQETRGRRGWVRLPADDGNPLPCRGPWTPTAPAWSLAP